MSNLTSKLATSSAVLIAAVAAQEAAAQAPGYNWTGFYVGINGGYSWGKADAEGIKFNTKGWQAGVQAGYNWHLSSLVIGPEIDFGLSGVHGKEQIFLDKDLKVHQQWAGSARLRVGLPLGGGSGLNGALLYGTGGLAVSGWRSKLDGDKDSQTHFGWVAGAGVELPFGSGWSGRVEYLYTDYGKQKHLDDGKIDFRQSTVRFGLSYRFGAPPPP